MVNGRKINYKRFRYTDREIPNGHLPLFLEHPGAHALFFYATMAMSRWHDVQKGRGVVMEEDEWPSHSINIFRNMLRAVELVYGIPIEKFICYWSVVDTQLAQEGLSMPKEIKFNPNTESYPNIILPPGVLQ